MTKFTIGGVVGFLAAIAAMYTANPSYFSDEVPAGQDGIYHVYSIKPTFDDVTGKPVYWIIGGKVRRVWMRDLQTEVFVHTQEKKFFSIPRDKVEGLPKVEGLYAENILPQVGSFRLDIEHSRGSISVE